jgi:hypothetical protein
MKRTIGGDMTGAAGAGDGPGEAGAAGAAAARRPLRELMDDRLLDALLERSRDQAGGLRLTGEGSMLGELVRAVLERALESELTAHRSEGGHRRYSRYQLRIAARARELVDHGTPVEAACRIVILEDQLEEAQRINAEYRRAAESANPTSAT